MLAASPRPVPFAVSGLLFAEDFADETQAGVTVVADDAADEPEVIAPPGRPEDPRLAEQRGHAEGLAEGLRQGLARAAATTQDDARVTLRAIAAALRDARADATRAAEAAAGELAGVLLAALGAVLPELCRRHGPREVAAFAAAVLPALRREPLVTVRVHASARPAVEAELERLDPDARARVALMTRQTMGAADIHIGWTDATALREAEALWIAVAGTLAPAAEAGAAGAAARDKETTSMPEVPHG